MVPGGLKGARTMSTTSTGIPELTKEYLDNGKYVGLICAGMYCILSVPVSNIDIYLIVVLPVLFPQVVS